MTSIPDICIGYSERILVSSPETLNPNYGARGDTSPTTGILLCGVRLPNSREASQEHILFLIGLPSTTPAGHLQVRDGDPLVLAKIFCCGVYFTARYSRFQRRSVGKVASAMHVGHLESVACQTELGRIYRSMNLELLQHVTWSTITSFLAIYIVL